MSESIEQRLKKLREELHRHNYLYYVQAQPEISDREYDALMNELIEIETAHPELETADSPSRRVGGQPLEGFRTVEHAVPMMSIDNTYDEGEVRAFDERVRKGLAGEQPHYVLEPKVDGVSSSLRYENGLLVLGATRGDGRRGDDITANVRTIHSIPLRLEDGAVPRIMEVRGEIYMPSAEFQRLNKQREANDEVVFANPRNATAGTLKQLDSRIVAKRRLKFVAHGMGEVQPLPTDSYWEWMKLLKKWGVAAPEYIWLAKNVDEVIRHIEEFATIRGKLPYQTDGMVIKIDSLAQRDRLGATSKAPRWVIAFKYPAEQMQTVLKEVIWQVGKGGTLTPVADLEPVFIAGTTVRRATLHNIAQIERLDLRVGDTIVLEKAGEVIPHVRQIVPEKRPKNAEPIVAPRKCPSCHTQVEREEGTPIIRCSNPECPAQLRERLIWFAGRKQMNIEGLGEKIIERLVDEGILKSYADFFHLDRDELAAALRRALADKGKNVKEHSGEKVADKILQSAESAKSRGLAAVLSGLGIPHVGATIARTLAEWAGDVHTLLSASERDIRKALSGSSDVDKEEASLAQTGDLLHRRFHSENAGSLIKEYISGVKKDGNTEEFLSRYGDKLGISHRLKPQRQRRLAERFPDVESLTRATPSELATALASEKAIAHSAYEFFHSSNGKKVISDLLAAGVKLGGVHRPSVDSPVSGKTVVITGTIIGIGRTELTDKLTELGANVTDSVSQKTDLVVVGEDPGSKLAKAESLGIKRIGAEEVFAIIGRAGDNAAKRQSSHPKGLFD